MKNKKESFSEMMKYALLILAILLLLVLIFFTLRVYQKYDKISDAGNIEILTEKDTEAPQTEIVTESTPESETERESESESESESETETESETEAETAGGGGSPENDAANIVDDPVQNTQDNPTNGQTIAGAGITDVSQAEDSGQEDSYQDSYQEEYTGDYHTIISTCNLRSYPDYGDNIIGECYTGDTVEFLGEEAGWYKVSLNGTVGYIGKRFMD